MDMKPSRPAARADRRGAASRAEDHRREVTEPSSRGRSPDEESLAQAFISAATVSAVCRKTGARLMASVRFRWLSRTSSRAARYVLAVEHPAVGAREQGIRDVTDARFERRPGLAAGPCPESTGTGPWGSLLMKLPSRASCDNAGPRINDSGDRKSSGWRARARAARRAMRLAMTSWRADRRRQLRGR